MAFSSTGPRLAEGAETPVQYVKGVGPRRAEALAAEGILTLADLVDHAPFRYEDRTQFRPIGSLRDSEWVLVRGKVLSVSAFQPRRPGVSLLAILLGDSSGSVPVKFFNQPYLRRLYVPGIRLVAYGQVRRDAYGGGSVCLMNPECEILEEEAAGSVHSGRVVPIYRKTGDMRARTLRQVMRHAIDLLPAELPDPVPEMVRRRLRLPSRRRALEAVHFPELSGRTPEERSHELDALNRGVSAAHKRMIFEELFLVQVGIRTIREKRLRSGKSRSFDLGSRVREAVKRILPFHPTRAQKRVLREIVDDMRSGRPMQRLLQGDVGSGKTIVAAQAAIVAVESGYQVAIMAPTEILAEQHFLYFRRLLSTLGYSIDLLTGGLRPKQKLAVRQRIESGETRIAIGTHALIQEDVRFHDLALVVVDEQHRFGVVQRAALMQKGLRPDVLVMTATPIPRSLALTLYGDLDVSVIDELPPGRKPIQTRLVQATERKETYARIREAVVQGRQVYVVYPIIDESEKSDLRAACAMADHLSATVFPDLSVGLLHGRMKNDEKERVMSAFASGAISILVSTTVIEVGVDVPNATLMVVEHAERFGLAQLHQLRGRVGRSAVQSHCILVCGPEGSPEARRRLEVLCQTCDGFRIAEADLELRGPGEIIGTRQSGIPVFRYANLVRDRRALEVARTEADRFIAQLRASPDNSIRRCDELIRRHWRVRHGLALVG